MVLMWLRSFWSNEVLAPICEPTALMWKSIRWDARWGVCGGVATVVNRQLCWSISAMWNSPVWTGSSPGLAICTTAQLKHSWTNQRRWTWHNDNRYINSADAWPRLMLQANSSNIELDSVRKGDISITLTRWERLVAQVLPNPKKEILFDHKKSWHKMTRKEWVRDLGCQAKQSRLAREVSGQN